MRNGEVVHIIDDDPSICSALRNLVASAGVEAICHESVKGFLEHQHEAVAGCVLLDVRLPGVGGLEFLTSTAGHSLRRPVILMTGHGDIPMTVKGMRAGAIDFLTKPFGDNAVLEAISRALAVDRKRRAQEAGQADAVARFGSLSTRERQVMALVTTGKMNKQVAGDLGLSEITVKVHRGSLMRKMGIRTLADLVKLAGQLAASHAVSTVHEDA